MAFFRTVSFSEPLPIIEGDTVYLRAPQMSDYGEWATLREASRAFLTPWEPTWPADDLTRAAFRRRLRRYAEDQRSDQSYAFFLFRKSDHALAGGLTLANIRRGVAQAGSLGYWIGEPFARRGLMTGAVQRAGAVRVRLAAAAPARGGLHSLQRRLDPAVGKFRLRARGLCARISLHQRAVAGSPAVRAADRELIHPWDSQGCAAITTREFGTTGKCDASRFAVARPGGATACCFGRRRAGSFRARRTAGAAAAPSPGITDRMKAFFFGRPTQDAGTGERGRPAELDCPASHAPGRFHARDQRAGRRGRAR